MKLTGSQIIIKMLEAEGITTVAGIPGGSILPFYDCLAHSEIRHILVRQEQAAGFIAQGMARTTGRPAVCLATSGPGAMNLLTAIADARCDSIPIVAITGQVNSALIGTDAFQEADTFGLSFPITKHSILIKTAEELIEAVPKAFEIAVSGRPGPVLIDVPRDVQSAVCDVDESVFHITPAVVDGSRRQGTCAGRFCTPRSEYPVILGRFAELLAHAHRPVLYVGGGCASPEAASLVADFRSVYRIPVVTSLMGIGVVPSSDEGNLGMVGMHGAYAANRALYESDLVFAAGARFDDRATGVSGKFCPKAKIVHIDIDAAEVNKILPAYLSLVADVESALPVLTELIREQARDCACAAGAERAVWYEKNTAVKKESTVIVAGRPQAAPLPNPRAFIAGLPDAAKKAGIPPESLIVATDVGQHQMWTAQWYPVEKPRTFLTSGSLGTMGFGLPAAIGAALANPDKRILCISGDGSILMNIQELATLADHNLNVTVIVLENGTLGMVYQQQKYLFNKTYSACIFEKQPDLLQIASGFGISAVDANTDSAWFEKAFPKHGPAFVRLHIGFEEDVLPYVSAGKANIDAVR
jgi:acetolactate synthase I/II/III large subunit